MYSNKIKTPYFFFFLGEGKGWKGWKGWKGGGWGGLEGANNIAGCFDGMILYQLAMNQI